MPHRNRQHPRPSEKREDLREGLCAWLPARLRDKSSWSRRYWPLDILQQVFDRFRGAILRELDGIVNLRADFRFDAFQIRIFQEAPFPEARLEEHDRIAFLPLLDFRFRAIQVRISHRVGSETIGS